MGSERISISNHAGEKLIGLKRTPKVTNEKNPAVILVHGFAYYKEEDGLFDDLAELFSGLGMIVYRFDFSGCGESEGDFSDSSLTKLRRELETIWGFVQNDEGVDSNRIGFLGQSFGTTVTIALSPKADFVILLGAPAYPGKRIAELFGKNYNPENLSVLERGNGRITRIKPHFWQDLKNYDVLTLIHNLKCPILFAHGENDTIVPASDMESLFKKANAPKEKQIIPRADHGMKPSRDKLYKIIREWASYSASDA